MSHEFETPRVLENTPSRKPLDVDSYEPDTALVAGTRKLAMVLFWLLRMPPIPSQEELDAHLEQVARDSEGTTPPYSEAV